MLLENHAVVLAGATGRVGRETLETLVREGGRVVVVSRSEVSAREMIGESAGGERAIAHLADITVPEAAASAVEACVERFGRIDALVNLAGRGKFVSLVESTPDDLRLNVDGFLVTAYNLALPALRAMLAQPYLEGRRSRGHIVTVTAGSSRAPQPRFGLFGAAKAGVNVLMQAIAREHKADGIVANALVLGTVATDAAREYLGPEDFSAAASPQEVADVLSFLASSRSSGINGALVDLNAREVD